MIIAGAMLPRSFGRATTGRGVRVPTGWAATVGLSLAAVGGQQAPCFCGHGARATALAQPCWHLALPRPRCLPTGQPQPQEALELCSPHAGRVGGTAGRPGTHPPWGPHAGAGPPGPAAGRLCVRSRGGGRGGGALQEEQPGPAHGPCSGQRPWRSAAPQLRLAGAGMHMHMRAGRVGGVRCDGCAMRLHRGSRLAPKPAGPCAAVLFQAVHSRCLGTRHSWRASSGCRTSSLSLCRCPWRPEPTARWPSCSCGTARAGSCCRGLRPGASGCGPPSSCAW